MRAIIGLIPAILCVAWLTGCSMSNAEQRSVKNFRFENYRDDKSLVEALLKLHPPGSSVEAARQTMERAGAKCRASGYGEPIKRDGYSCAYYYSSDLLKIRLHISVIGNYQDSDVGKVLNFSAWSQMTGM